MEKFGISSCGPSLRRIFLTTAGVALLAGPVQAENDCDEALVPQPETCARANADIVVRMPAGENTERDQLGPGGDFATSGFSISLDNETVSGAPVTPDAGRTFDIDAARADVDVRYDGLDIRRLLNVSTSDLRAAFRAGETVEFRASTNYPAWITRAELRILDRAARGRPAIASIPTAPNGTATWTMPEDGSGDYAYVLRVYDAEGRYDETIPLTIIRTERAFDTHDAVGKPVIAAGEGEDRTGLRNISVRGGRITAAGEGAPPGGTVTVMGEAVPVDGAGRFVTSRILPAGDHVITVEIDQNGRQRQFVRDVAIPRSEWFHVGIVDLTLGKRLRDDLASADPDYDDTYLDGRLAFYAKGRLNGVYEITASADTGEGPLEDAFRRLDEKDPRKVIQRLDPEDMYPTYGDDSSSFDDAPTSGRFYLQVERDASSLTWGDFRAQLTGPEFLNNTRTLYGAELRYAAPSVTENGDSRATVTVYAAQPDTLPQRDILRGTGGSVYFLSRQDINGGSETITLEAVDPVTGRVVSRTTLVEGQDYEIDYIQGVVILAEPLNSSTSDGSLVGTGSGELDVNLVAQYEYTPTAGSLDGAALGGRVEVWATDALRLGVTAMSETTGTADQRMSGADLRYEFGDLSHIEVEIAQTEGPGFGRSISTDGGLSIDAGGAGSGASARAYRVDSHFDLLEMGATTPGFVTLYFEKKEEGFSTVTEDITADQRLFGIEAEFEVSEQLEFGIDAETFRRDGGDRRDEAELRLSYALSSAVTLDAGIAFTDKVTVGDPDETGDRTDLALRMTWARSEDLEVYALGQVTLDEKGGLGRNNRLGVGFDARISEKVALSGEISDGDKGLGARARITYSPTADNELYLGYTLDPTRTGAGYSLVGRDEGTFVMGAKYRHSEALSTWGENTLDLFGSRRSLTEAYGVSYTPNAKWTLSGGLEAGTVRDAINGDFERDAYSLGVAYVNDDLVKVRARLEYRTEDGAGLAQDRETWALAAGYEYKVSNDWRVLANVDALFSDSDESSFRDGDYLEASLGYAYRPVDNERLNMLFRYTYLLDLPGEDQVTADGSVNGPKQKSQVVSVDAIYDLSPKLSVGGKYAFRKSEVAPRGTENFSDSSAHLGILRFDWHVVHKWDVMAEGRLLYTENDTRESGTLLGVYRHLGNGVKIGAGYEFGEVSDEVTDLDYQGRGVFLNFIKSF